MGGAVRLLKNDKFSVKSDSLKGIHFELFDALIRNLVFVVDVDMSIKEHLGDSLIRKCSKQHHCGGYGSWCARGLCFCLTSHVNVSGVCLPSQSQLYSSCVGVTGTAFISVQKS